VVSHSAFSSFVHLYCHRILVGRNDSDGADTGQSDGGLSINEDGEENDDSRVDLDASMEDMDEGEAGTASEAEDVNEMTNDFEKRSSDT
jgi:hypothetical protein